jgi:YidC/Oxa1 family membrane protein insertase
MDRRTLLAIGLMLIIAVVPTLLFPPKHPPRGPVGADTVGMVADSLAAAAARPRADTLQPRELPHADTLQPRDVPRADTVRPRAVPRAPVAAAGPRDTVGRDIVVHSPLYRYVFSTRGGRLTAATLFDYRTYAPGDTGAANIVPPTSRFLDYAIVVGGDTVRLADWPLEPSATDVTVGSDGATVVLSGERGGVGVHLTYRFRPQQYVIDVDGEVSGGSGFVLVGLGPQVAMVEADSVDDYRSYAVVTDAGKTEQVTFRSLNPGEQRVLSGPFEWVAIKSKYFVTAVLTIGDGQPRLGGAVATGGERSGRLATRANVVLTLPAPGGHFTFSTYVGPQEYRRLKRIGHDLEDVNPYGWIFRPIIRPFTNLIVVILLWMHQVLSMPYGWVLILFGLVVRVVLWPLNQKAMRSSVAMQAIQPEIKAIQEKYKQEPQRMQQEVMKVYKEHGVNPVGGCLPMLIPMPVLFALFFVFRQTIELRGVPFLWLPDLSRADPYYVIPIVMGISMFALSKIGQIGVPPNPQTKMMTYAMPAFMTFIFLRLSSGLNLYYAVSNLASLPQQWLIARERQRRIGRRE